MAMIKYITILFLLFSVAASAQYVPNAGAYQWKGGKFVYSFQVPSGHGMPATSINAPDSNWQALYYNLDDTTLYQFNPVEKTWSPITGQGAIGPLASIFSGTCINIFDSSYNPFSEDVTIAVDTSCMRDFITQVINGDTTIINNNDSIATDWVVDTLTGTPPSYATSGFKVLVSADPPATLPGPIPNPFFNHDDEIAELVGTTWTFNTADNNDLALVDNFRGGMYQYTASSDSWRRVTIFWQGDGNAGIGRNTWIGKRDKQPVWLRSWNKTFLWGDTTQDVYTPKWSGLEDSAIYFRPGINGKVDTGYFRQLVAGTGVTITPGENRTDTISTEGGSGSGISYNATVTATNGQTVFTFSGAAIPSKYIVFVNGSQWDDGYSGSGTDITLTATDIVAGDKVTLVY